jgi:proton glutamate symport protein
MSLTTRVVGGLALGLAAGAAINASRQLTLLTLASWIEPVGTLWVNAILMTVIPLVVSSLILGVASRDDPRLIVQLGRRAFLFFLLLVCVSSGITALIAPSLFAWLPIDTATSASLRASAAASATHPVQVPATLGQWLVGLVPSNPVKAAADGALLPLVVFTLAFALAVLRLPTDLRLGLVRFFEAVASAMRILVEWVLVLAPLGVFALALPLAARLGVVAAGALGYYVALVSILPVAFLLLLYPVVSIAGQVSMRRFARAAAPAQAVALSSRSSLASLPALIEGAEHRLGLPTAITGFCLPLAVSTFKYCAPVVVIVGAIFIGRLYGIVIDPARLVEVAALAALLSFTVPGIPSGGIIAIAPAAFAVLGLPLEGVGMLIALDTVPDMFRVPANVTADLAVATILARHAPGTSTPLKPRPTALGGDGS